MTTKHEIGSVANVTGLTIHNLRVWERRHAAITPERSQDGRRLYSDKDIERLTRLKRCVDNGDRIGNIANLDDEALRERAEKFDRHFIRVKENIAKDTGLVRMGLAGMPLFRRTLETFATENDYQVRISFGVSTISDVGEAYKTNVVDCVVTEVSNITDEIATQLVETSSRINGVPIVVLHHFSRSEVRRQLEVANIWPINSLSSAAATLAIVLKKAAHKPETELTKQVTQPMPPAPIFSTLQLSVIQQIEASLPCECPRHVSGIVRSLRAFEEYSANCKTQNEEDALLHEEAKLETAKARHTMEQLLLKVLAADGIELNELMKSKADV